MIYKFAYAVFLNAYSPQKTGLPLFPYYLLNRPFRVHHDPV